MWDGDKQSQSTTYFPAVNRSDLSCQIQHVRVGVVEGKQESRQAVDVLLHYWHGQVLLRRPTHTHTHTGSVIHTLALPTLARRPIEAIWRWRADLVPQGDLPGVPAGDAGGEQPLHVAQEHHSVHPVVLAAGLLQETCRGRVARGRNRF